ncbi:hypothetical protein [Microbispora bryophytorum]|uniref:hypothetical protein n=1 Tax=Microbispora bryophytorum TaxID=1460882 RepID=UPI001CC2F1F2|nr:hypothetical protein [Microbispora camponoti]
MTRTGLLSSTRTRPPPAAVPAGSAMIAGASVAFVPSRSPHEPKNPKYALTTTAIASTSKAWSATSTPARPAMDRQDGPLSRGHSQSVATSPPTASATNRTCTCAVVSPKSGLS